MVEERLLDATFVKIVERAKFTENSPEQAAVYLLRHWLAQITFCRVTVHAG